MRQFCSVCGESMRRIPERGWKRQIGSDLGVYARFQVCVCGEAYCTLKVHVSPRLLLEVPITTFGEMAPEDYPAIRILKRSGVMEALGDEMKRRGWHGEGRLVSVAEFQEMNEVSRQWFNTVEVVWGPRTTVKIRPVPSTPEAEEAYQKFLDVWEFVGTKGLVPCPYGNAEDVLDFGECWWKRRRPTRNRCTALVPAGFWSCPDFVEEAR